MSRETPPATVYVTNMSPVHPYDSAARYGAVRPVTNGNYPVFKTERLTEEVIRSLAHSSVEDYLLFSGSSFVAGLCLAVWLAMHKECKALLWDARQKSYVPRTIKKQELTLRIEKIKDTIER